MDLETFEASLAAAAPPADLAPALQALWWDAKGDWDRAHRSVDSEVGRQDALVHAYLHRKEGDAGNAAYWYRQAGAAPAEGSLDTEWRRILEALLA